MRGTSALLAGLAIACVDDPVHCLVDEECANANPCDGVEVCVDGACAEGEPVACRGDEVCRAEGEVAVCGSWCDLPRAPNVSLLDDDEVLPLVGPGRIEVDVLPAEAALDEVELIPTEVVGPFEAGTRLRLVARTDAPGCGPADQLDRVYEIVEAYPGAATTPTSRAVPADDPRIVGWAAAIHQFTVGADVSGAWTDGERALGPADGTSTGVLALGRGGSVTVALAEPLSDGPGPDLAVFENAFSDGFLELGRVSVSTDGEHFATFDAAARTPEPVGAFGTLDPTVLHGLAGVYRQGFGTPFDLERLRFDEGVRRGFVRLDDVRFVRIDDVVGDGSDLDAWGRPIHDPFPTTGSAGFDLDAVAVLVAR